jgi:hypothetical protein
MTTAGRDERFAYAGAVAPVPPRPRRVLSTLELWESWWRDVLLSPPTVLNSADTAKPTEAAGEKYTVEDVERVLKATTRRGLWKTSIRNWR